MQATFLVLLLPVLTQNNNEAEKLFNKMEKQIQEAKTLRVLYRASCNIQGPKDKDTTSVKGMIALAPGNKTRLEMGNIDAGDSDKGTLASDGGSVEPVGLGIDIPKAAPANFHQGMRNAVTRYGLTTGIMAMALKDDLKPQLSDFQLGKKEVLDGREAQIVTYKMTAPKTKQVIQISLWIDVKSLLPLRRVCAVDGRDYQGTLTDTYSTITLNPDLDPKLFQLAK